MTNEPHSAEPPVGASELAHQLDVLTGMVKGVFRVTLSPNAVATLRRLLWRAGPGNYEDLVASIFLECWEQHKRGESVTEESVVRAADRLRQRLVRSARKLLTTEAVEQTAAAELPPEEELSLVLHEFQTFLEGRSPVDAILFQRYYLDGCKDVPALAADLGLAVSTVYRRLKGIRDGYLARRDMLEPPHFQD